MGVRGCGVQEGFCANRGVLFADVGSKWGSCGSMNVLDALRTRECSPMT
jgi:hypothetical protein